MEESIDLRQVLLVLFRGKWVISVIALVAMLVSGVMSFMVLDSTYEAATTLVVHVPRNSQSPSSSGLESLLDDLSSSPQTSLETLRLQATSPSVLLEVITDLQLVYSVDDLADKVSASVPKDTTLLQIKVRDADPQLAASIANTLVKHFTAHVESINQGRLQLTTQFLDEQLAAENEKLARATKELKGFLQQPEGPDELSRELSAKLNLLSSYEARLVQLQVELDASRAEVAAAERLASSLSPKLVTSRVVADDAVIHQLAAEASGDAAAVAGLRMESEEVNQSWMEVSKLLSVKSVELASLQAELASLDPVISRTRTELETLRVALVDKQTIQQQLQYQVDLSAAAIQILSQKSHENRLSEAARIAEASVTIVSEARPPAKPVAPRRAFILAMSALLGLMTGSGYVLFADYWRSGSPRGAA